MGLAQNALVAIVRGNRHLGGIAEALGSDRRALVKAIQQVKRRGLVQIDGRGAYTATAAGLDWVNSGREIKPGQGKRPRTATRGLRQRAWWVIRARKTVTLPELLSSLADGTEKNAANNLSGYLGPLVKAGFLVILDKRQPGHLMTSPGHSRYQLRRDNGRLAPVVRQSERVVFDPNTGETFPYGEAS
jgi:hypothetical protein